MEPVRFSEQCQTLCGGGPIANLPILTLHYEGLGPAIVSCWRLSLWELLRALFTGRIFVIVLGLRQPPMLLTTDADDIGLEEH